MTNFDVEREWRAPHRIQRLLAPGSSGAVPRSEIDMSDAKYAALSRVFSLDFMRSALFSGAAIDISLDEFQELARKGKIEISEQVLKVRSVGQNGEDPVEREKTVYTLVPRKYKKEVSDLLRQVAAGEFFKRLEDHQGWAIFLEQDVADRALLKIAKQMGLAEGALAGGEKKGENAGHRRFDGLYDLDNHWFCFNSEEALQRGLCLFFSTAATNRYLKKEDRPSCGVPYPGLGVK